MTDANWTPVFVLPNIPLETAICCEIAALPTHASALEKACAIIRRNAAHCALDPRKRLRQVGAREPQEQVANIGRIRHAPAWPAKRSRSI